LSPQTRRGEKIRQKHALPSKSLRQTAKLKKKDAEDAINFIDLVIAGPTIAGYHIWLAIAYFSRARIWWNFNAGFITIPVTSLLMGLTIYARIGIVGALIYRWWNYKRICHKPPVNFTTLED
jgi:uncharacterized protein (DUF983 family)